MLHSEHRILATHTGSLPRPPALTEPSARRARHVSCQHQPTSAFAGLIDHVVA